MTKTFGNRVLFRELDFSVFEKDRLGLIGPNGSGKSTLLKILASLENPDEGVLHYKKGLKLGYVPQTCSFPAKKPAEILLQAWEEESHLTFEEKEHHVKSWLSKLAFPDPECLADCLSGGWKKRLAFAMALMKNPDLLILDEPTNHLDLEGIFWLEKFLLKEVSSFIVVSHDRYFLEIVANRIVEIDRIYPKGSFSIAGSYPFFLEKKQEFLLGQIEQERSLNSKARYERNWLRQTPKARTTKAQARIDQAHEIFEELAQVHHRNQIKKTEISFDTTERETRKLLVVNNLCKKMGERVLFKQLNFILSPGVRIGLMGSNGSGKTTLLRLLAGECMPDSGTLKRADGLKVVYFDQYRALLPDEMTLREALSPTGDYVLYRGERIHVNGWCKRFLFSPDLLDLPLSLLSGGERARISIAHLMLQPADLLLLDEPTNDLDVATLETLEESLKEFPGAVILISHDRCLLDRICTTFLSLGDPEKTVFYADYAQWKNSLKPEEKEKKKREPRPAPSSKISNAGKNACKSLELKIVHAEQEQKLLLKALETLEQSHNRDELDRICLALGALEKEIQALYTRWYELNP